jgi:hypothetical protein
VRFLSPLPYPQTLGFPGSGRGTSSPLLYPNNTGFEGSGRANPIPNKLVPGYEFLACEELDNALSNPRQMSRTREIRSRLVDLTLTNPNTEDPMTVVQRFARVETIAPAYTPEEVQRQEMHAILWEAVARIHDVADGIAPTRRLESAAKLVETVMQRLHVDVAIPL